MMYDVYFPMCLNLALPANLLLMTSVNLLCNTAVVTSAWKLMRLDFSWAITFKYSFWATILGLLADFGALFAYEALAGPVGKSGTPYAPAVILAAGILIFVFNYPLALAFSLPPQKALTLAATISIVTAPWTLLLV
ncbi:MAG: hypothetical protein ACOCVQ_00770 [Bacillota bacterium]